MQAATAKASAGLEVELFVKDLDREVCVEASEALGSEKGAGTRVWLRRFRSVRQLLAPAIVLPMRDNFWVLNGSSCSLVKVFGPRPGT